MELLTNDMKVELSEILLSFLDSYLSRRCLADLEKIFHKSITFFSLFHDNDASNCEAALTYFEKEIKYYPSPINYKVDFYEIIPLDDKNVYITLSISLENMKFQFTIIFTKVNGKWQIIHLHQSSRYFDINDKSPVNMLLDRSKQLEAIVDERTKELTAVLKEMEYNATHDNLTNLYNRYRFNEVLKDEILTAKNNKTSLSIILGDVDYFKQVNDKFGHMEGDKALIEISNTLKQNTRSQDIVTRWGGEEFIILTPCTTLVDAISMADRIRVEIEKSINSNHMPLTISFGVAELSADDTIDTLLNKVDLALYKAKRKGRNRVEI